MSQLGTIENPLRVAIVGAGPAGFYAAADLIKRKIAVEVDIFDRLPTPFGLVRAGVAPDHQKIKSVTKIFERVAKDKAVRFFGNVELGKHVTVADLEGYYHQILYSTGAQTDRSMGIPGEELAGSHAATEFVAWYNGHPDFCDCEFDFSAEKVAVVGVGNVALDVARILCRTREELLETDIADYAMEALVNSSIKEVYILGRRGPGQVKFTLSELKELGEMAGADALAEPSEVELDELSRADLEAGGDRNAKRMVEILEEYGRNQPSGKEKRIIFRFLVSPVELIGDEHGRIRQMKIVKNELYQTDSGDLRPRATDQVETLDVDMVFRSIGYLGVPLPDVPFHERWGVILNEKGRVLDQESKEPLIGHYTAGWIKRGPTGVIGTNKADAVETVEQMMEDFEAGQVNQPAAGDREGIVTLLEERQPFYFSFDDWLKLDELELEKGSAEGRPRVKFTTVAAMLEAVKKG